jgi:JAB1/Mov34/MPN/PAD-1 ubiquitin protease
MDIDNYDATAALTNQKNDKCDDDDNDNNTNDELLSMLMIQKLHVADVIVHPLVLLSVADHYHRVARGTRKRVIGILLGQSLPGGTMDITNSFALPFEEDSKNPVRCLCVCVYGDGYRCGLR